MIGGMQLMASMGPTKQIESHKENSFSPMFGSGTRDQREKIYLDAESEKTYFGRGSPGPCAYESKV